jgi:hypothetical protein
VWLCHIEVRGRCQPVLSGRLAACVFAGMTTTRSAGARVRRPRPWESEQAAFSFLLRVMAIAVVVVLVATLLKAIF